MVNKRIKHDPSLFGIFCQTEIKLWLKVKAACYKEQVFLHEFTLTLGKGSVKRLMINLDITYISLSLLTPKICYIAQAKKKSGFTLWLWRKIVHSAWFLSF